MCKAPFFATKDRVMDLEAVVEAQPKPQPAPPLTPYERILRAIEQKNVSDVDSTMVATIIWENERCRLLRDHSAMFVASFLHRIVAANRLDFFKYLFIREAHELMRYFRDRMVQEHVAPNLIDSRAKVEVAKTFLNKLSVFFVENRSSQALGRILASMKEVMQIIVSGAAGPTNLLFSRHPEPLASFALFMARTPQTAPVVIGSWFCAVMMLGNMERINWVFTVKPQIELLLNRLNADCFNDYMRCVLHMFPTKHLSVDVFQQLVARFPWLVKVAWADFTGILAWQGTYFPLALHLYQNHYDQVPVLHRCISSYALHPAPPELEPWRAHYLFDPVAVKWYCAPHKHIADKEHHQEVEPGFAARPGTRVTVLGKEPLPVDPIPVSRLHVFYFARANAERGEASLWDIPDAKYDDDNHKGWRYWKLDVLPKTAGAKRIPLVPGTTLVFDHGISAHNITNVNAHVF